MIERHITQLIPTAGLAVVCAALGMAWVIAPMLAPGGWAGRLAVLLVGVSLALLVVRITFVQAAKSAQAARRYIDSLCGLGANELNNQDPDDAIPVRKEDRLWRDLCQRVRQRLADYAHRTEELEMARAAADVRVRRIVAERDLLAEILSGLIDPVLAVDQFGEIVLANPSDERLLDVKTGEDNHPELEQLTKW